MAGGNPSPNGFLSKEAFLGQQVKEETVEVSAGRVQVRGFKKGEEQAVRDAAMVNGRLDTEKYEMLALLQGLVEPKFAEEDLAALKDVNAGDFNRVLEKILELSGLTEQAEKAVAQAFR